MTTQTKTTMPDRSREAKAGWRKVKLEDTLQLLIDHRGKTPKKLGGAWSLHGIPAISAKNIKNGKIVSESDIRYVSPKLYDKWMPEKLKKGDVLLTSEAPLGELLYLKEKMDYCLSQRVFALRAQPRKLYSRFLYYYLLSPIGRHQMLRRISGTAAEGIRQAELRQLEVSFPENPEDQKRIADILSAFDDKIELNNKISRTLEEMAQAIFKEWFVKKSKCKNQNAKLWQVKNVMEIVKRIPVGKKYDNKTALPVGKVPILDQGQSGYIGYHNDEPGVVASIDESVVVFTNHTCNYRLMMRPFSAIQNVLPYIGINGYPTLFVYYLTRGKITMQEYKGHWPEFEQQEFLVPPPGLAVEFASYVKPMIQKMVEMENENQKLAALRDLLLPKLMSGEIRV